MRSATNILVLMSLLMATEMRAAAEDLTTDDPCDPAILRQQGAEPDRANLSRVLRDLQPSETQRERIPALIAQLGSDEYREREAATEELIRIPNPRCAS